MADDAPDIRVGGTRRDRFDLARIPHEMMKDDPYVILATVRELVARQNTVGDLILVACPPDSTHGDRGLLAKVQRALEADV